MAAIVRDNSYGGTGDDTFLVTGGDFGDNVYGGADVDMLDLSGWTIGAIAFNVNLQLQTYAVSAQWFRNRRRL